MLVLGINGGFGGGTQDTAAVLIENGTLLAAVEEERLSRVKHAKGQIPYLAIIEVLDIANKKASEINMVAFHGATWGKKILYELKKYFLFHFGITPQIKRYHHHLCHAASVFYLSPFQNSLVVTSDNSGDGDSIHIYNASKKYGLRLIKSIERPNSFGLFYSLITQYCGFQKDRDEYKLMALSGFGKPNISLDFLIKSNKGDLKINKKYIIKINKGAPSPTEQVMLFNQHFINALGFNKAIKQNYKAQHLNLAASAQFHLEKEFAKLVDFYLKQLNLKNLCVAGGVALNGKLNGSLINPENENYFFTNNCSNDAGVALGAAILASLENKFIVNVSNSACWGREFTLEQIKDVLNISKVPFTKCTDKYAEIRNALLNFKIVAHFEGASEFGPRALGNRSILANPFQKDIKTVLNKAIKNREGFRPFGIIITEEGLKKYFEKYAPSPYMNIVFKVKAKYLSLFKEVVHTDNTVRVQTVNSSKLLNNQLPFVINTSFNHNKEPMIYSPEEAIRTFYGSGIDECYIESYKLVKP